MATVGISTNLKTEQRLDTSMIQMIDMITMPCAELNEKIKEEAAVNPALDVKENTSSYEAIAARSGSSCTFSDEANSKEYSDDDTSMWFERTVGEREDLKDHLIKELGCLSLSPEIRETAENIISALDPSGFTGPEPETLVPERLKEYVSDALKAVQSLDPTGVGAKDWKEALMLQIREIEKDRDERQRYRDIIYKGLEYIKNGEEDKLARALRIGREDLDAMLGVLKSLTPFPGLKYTSAYTPYIFPELSITVEDGVIVMRTLSGGVVDVEINEDYVALGESLKDEAGTKEKEARRYIKRNLTSAENLMKLLSYRKTTIEKMGLLLIKRQRDFFLYGPMHLNAMTMTKAAEELGISVSTVSKLAQEKYILTPWGTLPLRFFFSTEVKSENDDVSKTAVIYRIKEIIENNSTGKKLTDQKIADMLQDEGLKVARRTVNKYRRELGE